jgi:SHOCT-like domain
METITLEVGASPDVQVQSVGGDLRIVGRGGSMLEAQAPAREDLTVTREGDHVTVASRVGCLLFLPDTARLEIGAVGGDARLSGITGEVSLVTVGGDLNLRGMGSVRLGRVAGDARIIQASGAVVAEWVGGDVRCENLQTDLDIGLVEGSLSLQHLRGAVRAESHGDILAQLMPPPGSQSRLQAGGDLVCRLLPDASVLVTYGAEGDARVALPSHVRTAGSTGTAQLGAGEAKLDLEASGDLRVSLIGVGAAGLDEEWRQDLEARIEAEVDAALAQVERSQKLSGLSNLMPDDIAERIRVSMSKARRRAKRANRMAEAGAPHDVRIHLGEPAASATAVGDKERLEILRMVESGAITVEQAEQLFRAMEGNA